MLKLLVPIKNMTLNLLSNKDKLDAITTKIIFFLIKFEDDTI